MADGRRHSIDVPISRTLVALRRVRSLRDPCTNSMSKFATVLDNVNWETSSNNGISLQFVNCEEGAGTNDNGLSGSSYFEFDAKRGEPQNGFVSHCSVKNESRVENMGSLVETERVGGLKENELTNRSLDERRFSDFMDKGMELACFMPSRNPVEDVDSSNGPNVGFSPNKRRDECVSRQSYRSKNLKKSPISIGDFASRIGSPIPSTNYDFPNRSTSLYQDEDVDVADHCNQGCGIGYCWSRTPKFRESNSNSDVEDYPLLSGNTTESSFGGNACWKRDDVTPCLELPRSLSQKFRPKSFDELVGQEVIAKSLLSAISRGRISSVYLFHGPRGTGKTSTSRIFSAALNCLSLAENKPCSSCRECVSFFSGRSRDVKEVDSVKVNRTDRLRYLVKSAFIPPVSSRFKIFIIDECQLLHQETWATILNGLDNFSQHAVFVLVCPDLDKLPRSVVSRSQKYHFPNIKDADIASRLAKICIEEGLDFDQGALDFIAAKSNGSLRDGEMMLDQLSLLGKRITMSLAYELIGVVSDDELLDLLDLALSCDTSNTVIRARELMRSKVDPMQLITQLANVIMDILAGKCQEGSSEARRQFCKRHTSEEELQKLSHALRILSDAEKHLRASKNQTTWLTVALLQLSSVDSSAVAANDSRLCLKSPRAKDVDFCSTSSEVESLKDPVSCPCDAVKSPVKEHQENCKGRLESIWKRVTESCNSDSFKNFLWKRGKLASLCVNKGLAVAELEFYQHQHVSRAEKSWKLIASAFQSILGCNVEIRINLVICSSSPKNAKARRLLFGLLSCSRRMRPKSSLSTISDSDQSDYASEKHTIDEGRVSTSSTGCGAHQTDKMMSALRSSEGNVLSTITASMRPQKVRSSDASSRTSCAGDRQDNELVLSIPERASNRTYICGDAIDISRGSCEEGDGRRENLDDVLCWRTPTLPLTKAWRETHQNRSSRIIGCVLPCAAATN